MMTSAVALAPDETIAHIVRRHWFHLAIVGAVDVFLFTLATILLGGIDTFLIAWGAGQGAVLYVSSYLFALTGLILWMHFFGVWSDHWLDAWIITNKRIIDIEQKGFFSRKVSSFPLARIQDVTFETHGLLAMWLHFGDVRIQTASISDDFIMRQIGNPDIVKEKVMAAIETARPTE